MNLFPKDDVVSPSSASEEEDSEKKQQKKLNQKKIRKKLSKFFKLRLEKEKGKDGHGSFPQRPNTLPVSKKAEPAPTIVSPSKCHTLKQHKKLIYLFAKIHIVTVWDMHTVLLCLSECTNKLN